jgi:hypothetical protein
MILASQAFSDDASQVLKTLMVMQTNPYPSVMMMQAKSSAMTKVNPSVMMQANQSVTTKVKS